MPQAVNSKCHSGISHIFRLLRGSIYSMKEYIYFKHLCKACFFRNPLQLLISKKETILDKCILLFVYD